MSAPRCPVCRRVVDVSDGRVLRHSRPPLGAPGLPLTEFVTCEGAGRGPASRRDLNPRGCLDDVAAALLAGHYSKAAQIIAEAGYGEGAA